ncbi:TPA: hypothetical protein ACH6AG_000064 [Campylobacter jejuni]
MGKLSHLLKLCESSNQLGFEEGEKLVKKFAKSGLDILNTITNDSPSKFCFNGLMDLIGNMKLMNKTIDSLVEIANSPLFNDKAKEQLKPLKELGQKAKGLLSKLQQLSSECEKSGLSDDCMVATHSKLGDIARELKPILEKICQD